jgi:hypothetical protein
MPSVSSLTVNMPSAIVRENFYVKTMMYTQRTQGCDNSLSRPRAKGSLNVSMSFRVKLGGISSVGVGTA